MALNTLEVRASKGLLGFWSHQTAAWAAVRDPPDFDVFFKFGGADLSVRGYEDVSRCLVMIKLWCFSVNAWSASTSLIRSMSKVKALVEPALGGELLKLGEAEYQQSVFRGQAAATGDFMK